MQYQVTTYLTFFDHVSNSIDREWHSTAKTQNGETQDYDYNFLLNNNNNNKKTAELSLDVSTVLLSSTTPDVCNQFLWSDLTWENNPELATQGSPRNKAFICMTLEHWIMTEVTKILKRWKEYSIL